VYDAVRNVLRKTMLLFITTRIADVRHALRGAGQIKHTIKQNLCRACQRHWLPRLRRYCQSYLRPRAELLE